MAEEALNAGGPTGEPVGPFRALDTATRRRAGMVYLIVALFAAGVVLASGVDVMWLTAVMPIVLLAVFQVAGGWKLKVTDMEAIAIASEHASFEVGHGSGTLGFRGWLAKPVWQVLVFAAGPAPDYQALITVDGLTGEILGSYEEEVPAP